jgi:outer membrane lipoprotein SlyB
MLSLAGCKPDLSPNTYNAAAVQQANKVEQGVVVGVRQVTVKVAGTNGALAGAAAGGVVGSTVPGSSTGSALGAVGGSLIGGLIGSSAERAAGDTQAFEYIVRKQNGELVSVTQSDSTALALGQRVLVIAGSQARIVPDYTTLPPEQPKDIASKPAPVAAPAKPASDATAPEPAPPAPAAASLPAPTSLIPPPSELPAAP